MKFQPKFKVGDMVIFNNRAPKEYRKYLTSPQKIIKISNSIHRTHLLYFIPVPKVPATPFGEFGFFSDELRYFFKKTHRGMYNVGRDSRGRFISLKSA